MGVASHSPSLRAPVCLVAPQGHRCSLLSKGGRGDPGGTRWSPRTGTPRQPQVLPFPVSGAGKSPKQSWTDPTPASGTDLQPGWSTCKPRMDVIVERLFFLTLTDGNWQITKL